MKLFEKKSKKYEKKEKEKKGREGKLNLILFMKENRNVGVAKQVS